MREALYLFNIAFGMWAIGCVLRGVFDNISAATDEARLHRITRGNGLRTRSSLELLPAALLLLFVGVLKETIYRLRMLGSSPGTEILIGMSAGMLVHPQKKERARKNDTRLKVVMVYVPGTWSNMKAAAPAIVQWMEEQYPSRRILTLRWAAKNNAIARNKAAEYLAESLVKDPHLRRANKVYLIGHSHGGTVCAAAASIASDPRCKVVTLGAPFVEFTAKEAIDWGAFMAVFGVIVWPLALCSYFLGALFPIPDQGIYASIVRIVGGILIIALIIKIALWVKVMFQLGPQRGYASSTNIVAKSDFLIQTMNCISEWFDKHTLILSRMRDGNLKTPQLLESKFIGLISLSVWLVGFILFTRLSAIGSALYVVPVGLVLIWFYLNPSALLWRLGTFVPTIVFAAHPGAVLLVLSTAVNFGIDIATLAIGKARVVICPRGSSYISAILADIHPLQRIANAHSSMLNSEVVKAILIEQLKLRL